MNTEMTENFQGFSVEKAARAIGIASNTLRLHVRRGNAHVIRCGRRVIIPGAEVSRILREGLPSLATEKVGSVQ